MLDLKVIEAEQKKYLRDQKQIQAIIKVLEKGQKQRSEKDLEKLQVILKDLPFLQQKKCLQPSDFKDLASHMRFEQKNAFEEIYQYQSETEKYYYILKGSVKEFVPNTQEISDFHTKWKEYQDLKQKIEDHESEKLQRGNTEKNVNMQRRQPRKLMTMAAPMNFKIQEEDMVKQITDYDEYDWFAENPELIRSEQVFGQEAVNNVGKRISKTICIQECFFATIEKSDIQKILAKAEARHVQHKIDFFSKQPFLQLQTQNQIKKFIDYFKVKEFKINQFVFNQGETPKYIFIVFSGQFELQRKTALNRTPQHQDETTRTFLGKSKSKFKKPDQVQDFYDPVDEPSGAIRSFSLEKLKYYQNFRLSNCCNGQIVGLEDALKQRNHTLSFKCVSATGSVYRIKIEDFILKMQRDDKTWGLVQEIVTQKDKMTIEKLKQAVQNKKVGVKVNNKQVQYINVITKNRLKKTEERVHDFRQTMKEIIDVKNGKILPDYEEQVPVNLMRAPKQTMDMSINLNYKTPQRTMTPIRITTPQLPDQQFFRSRNSSVMGFARSASQSQSKLNIATTFFRDRQGLVQTPNSNSQARVLRQKTRGAENGTIKLQNYLNNPNIIF